MTEAEPRSDFGSTKNNTELTHKGEVWGVYCEYFGENWPYHTKIALYHNIQLQIIGLGQERRNSSASAMELHLACTNSSKWLAHLSSASFAFRSASSFSFRLISLAEAFWLSRSFRSRSSRSALNSGSRSVFVLFNLLTISFIRFSTWMFLTYKNKLTFEFEGLFQYGLTPSMLLTKPLDLNCKIRFFHNSTCATVWGCNFSYRFVILAWWCYVMSQNWINTGSHNNLSS